MKLEAFDKNNANKKKFYIISSLVIALIITIVSIFTMSIYEVQTTDVSVVNATVKFNNAVLKATTSSDTSAFRSSTYRTKIKTLTFEDEVNIPVGATQWDIGVDPEMIYAYVVQNTETPSYYDLHIQSDVPMNANEDMSYWFIELTYLDSIEGLELVNFSNTKNMLGMFAQTGYNSTIFTLDLGDNFDTSNVTNMYGMFYETGYKSTLFTLDLEGKFDTSNVTDMSYMFAEIGYKCTVFTLDLGDKFDTSNVTDMSYMFYKTALKSTVFTLDLGDKFDTSNVTDMSYMFECMGIANETYILNLGDNFDTSKVTNMAHMFSWSISKDLGWVGYNHLPTCSHVEINFGNKFNTSNVTNMAYMFKSISYTDSGTNDFELDLSNFNTSNVTNMEGLFYLTGYGNPNFELDVSNFDTSKVTNMNSMFYGTGYNNPNFTLDVSNFDTSKVTDMSAMFKYLNVKSLDLSNFDTSNVTIMGSGTSVHTASPHINGMFSDCRYLENIIFGENFDTSNVTNMMFMFYFVGYYSTNLKLDFKNFDTSSVTDMYYMFYQTGHNNPNFTLDISNFDTSNVTNMEGMFAYAGYSNPNFTLDVNNFDTSNVTNMERMFEGTGYSNPNFTLDVSHFDTSNVTDMAYMFYSVGYSNPNFTLDLSDFDTSKVTDMSAMFKYLNVKSLDLSNFDTSKVTNMSSMFNHTGYSNPNFTLDVSNFDTSNVTNMERMFEGTGYSNPNFELDLSSFDTSNVTSMNAMFSGDLMGSNRKYLKIKFGNNFDTSNVTNMSYMFYKNGNLILENYNGFDTSKVTNMSSMFSDCKKVNIQIDILIPNISNSNNYRYMFNNAATESGSDIKVNYTSENQSLVEAMVATKYPTTNDNVHIGDLLTEHTIIINDSNVTSNLTSALKTKKTTLSTNLENKIIKSFKMNGNTINGKVFVMPNENVTITDIEYYEITVPNTITTNITNETKIGDEIILTEINVEKTVSSFKLNGEYIEGNTFIMPDEDVEITDVVFYDYIIIESEHNPYPINMNNRVYYEHTFNGATSLTIELTYQTEGSFDYVTIYSSPSSSQRYNGYTKTTQTITLNSDYIKITFYSDGSNSNYYGFKAVITPNYD